MKATRAMCLALALAAFGAPPVWADVTEVWLTTKVTVALLTTEGLSVTGVHVAIVEGSVTLHGKVKTEAEKEKATVAVRSIEGVKDVHNLLLVVPDVFQRTVKVSDEAIKEGVQTALKSNKGVAGVKVTSVNNGVVLLAGQTSTPTERLRAIELAWNVGGVARVASEIETRDK
jgi:hyperosmotically inducible protein